MVPPFTKQLHPVFLPAMQACNVKLMCTARANLREECRHPPSPHQGYTKSAVSLALHSQQFVICYCLVISLLLHHSLSKFVYITHPQWCTPYKKKPGSVPAVHLAVNILEKRKQKDIVGGQVIMEATLFYQITP